MRRSMRQDILVTKPPKIKEHKARKRKNPNVRCEAFRLLMRRYISTAGTDNIDRDEWAAFCGVHIKTLNKWINGYPPREDLYYRIARYLAPKLHATKREVYEEIKETFLRWRAQ